MPDPEPQQSLVDESLRRRFEAAWLEGTPLTLAECLPEAGSTGYLPTLEELVHIQLEFSWKAHAGDGEKPALVEDLLGEFPALGERDILLRLLKQEYACRGKHGDNPTPAEYARRFPALVITGREVLTATDETVAAGPAGDAGTTDGPDQPADDTGLMDQPTILPEGGVAQAPGDQTLAMPTDGGSGSLQLPGQGDVVAGYRLESELGRGGMGVVYEAAHTESGRRVALKLLSPDLAGNRETMERFLREAKLAAALSHPRSTFVFEAGEDNGYPYIIMELMPGHTLKEVSEEEGPMPVNRAVDVILDVIDGLSAAHEAGVIHRDVKPSNCFMDSDGRVKVGDYGLSKSLVVESDLTQSGSFLGTPLYSAPEQVRGVEVDERTDLYAVGATLYALIAGRAPFTGESAAVIAQIVSDEAPLLSTMAEEIPADLDQVISRALEKDPDKRFQDLGQLKLALLPFATGGSSLADVGRRLAAYMIDQVSAQVVLAILGGLFGVLGSMWALSAGSVVSQDPGAGSDISVRVDAPSTGAQQMQTITLWNFAFNGVAIFAFFVLCEARSGQTPGKRMMRVRVVGANGTSPGWKAAILRSLVFFVPYELVALLAFFGSGMFQESGPSEYAPLLEYAKYLASLLLLSTMRSSNGFRAIHELASGTRVVSVPEDPRSRWARVPVVAPRLEAELPDQLGIYTPVGVMGWSGSSQVLLARDEALDRSVWITSHENSGTEPSRERTELSRSTRPRWLQSGTTDATHWQAYEAVHGSPLSVALQQKNADRWERGRHVAQELAAELAAAVDDGTLPDTLFFDQVWLGRDGHVKVLDSILQREAGNAPSSEGGHSGTGLLKLVVQAFSRDQVLPGHARDLIDELATRSDGPETLHWTADRLQETENEPVEIKWRDRMGIIGLSMALDGVVIGVVVNVLIWLLRIGYPDLPQLVRVIWFSVPPTMLVAFALGASLRGGLAFRMMKIEVQQTNGQPARRMQCGIRYLVTYLPLAIFSSSAVVYMSFAFMAFQPGVDSQAVMTQVMEQSEVAFILLVLVGLLLAPNLFFVGFLWTILNPRRGPQDLIAGTQLVPR